MLVYFSRNAVTRRYCCIGIVLAAGMLLNACSAESSQSSDTVKRYVMRGEVLRLDQQHNLATIKHEAIKGWMDAMTMDYKVRDRAEFEKLHEHEQIIATVFVQGDDYWIGEIRPAP